MIFFSRLNSCDLLCCKQIVKALLSHGKRIGYVGDISILVDYDGVRYRRDSECFVDAFITIKANPALNRPLFEKGHGGSFRFISDGNELNRLVLELLRQFVHMRNGGYTRPAPSCPELQDDDFTSECAPVWPCIRRSLQQLEG